MLLVLPALPNPHPLVISLGTRWGSSIPPASSQRTGWGHDTPSGLPGSQGPLKDPSLICKSWGHFGQADHHLCQY